MQSTTIEWTDATWNPVTGCTKVSRGCDNCYAERIAKRFYGESGFNLKLKPQRLEQPLKWRAPRMIFVNSMSDLFHKEIPKEYIDKVFSVMEKASWHTFQVLTKRSSLMRDYVNNRYSTDYAPRHIWLGVSIEDNQAIVRVQHLQQAKASVRFLSIEPLLENLNKLDLHGIHWVIVGGESGPNARTINGEWVAKIRDQCLSENVPFFFKQWGGITPKANGRTLHGIEWNQIPTIESA